MGKAFLQQIRLGGYDEVRGRVFIHLTFSVVIITPRFLLGALRSLFLCFTTVCVDTKVTPERPEGPDALLGHTDVLPGLTGCQCVSLHAWMGHVYISVILYVTRGLNRVMPPSAK